MLSRFLCGHSSVVERNLAKVDVARSNRVARSLVKKTRKYLKLPPSSRGLGRLPFTEQTGIRIPLGVAPKPSFDSEGLVVN